MTSEWLTLLLLMSYLGLCVAAVLINQRLLKVFTAKRPDLVAKYLPEATVRNRHPQKFFFFLKPSAAKILAGEAELLKLRRYLIWLSVCILVFLLIIVIMMILVVATQ